MPPDLAALSPAVWPAVTIGVYLAARWLHGRFGAWWSSPLLLTWGACLVLLLALHVSYQDYLRGTGWLMALLGPATIAFAVPIYEARDLIRRNWRVLAIGVATGSLLSVACSFVLARMMGFPPDLFASLLPRSISTPFALMVSQELGGAPGLTASFTAITGLFGVLVVGPLIRVLGVRTSFARGALLGAGAHGAGVARAYQFGVDDGSIASMVMILTGLLNVTAAGLYVGLAAAFA